MNKTTPTQIIDGLNWSRGQLKKLAGFFSAPEPPAEYLSGLNRHSLWLEINRAMGSSPFILGCFSCSAGAGSTTVASEIARLLAAEKEGEVVLVAARLRSDATDSDPRRGELSPGFTEYLLDQASLDDIVRESPGEEYLSIPAGSLNLRSAMPGTFSSRLTAFSQEAKRRFDAVILDFPPNDSLPDALSLSTCTDGLVLVLESGVDTWEAASAAKKTVEKSGGRLIGAIINKHRHYVPEWLYGIL